MVIGATGDDRGDLGKVASGTAGNGGVVGYRREMCSGVDLDGRVTCGDLVRAGGEHYRGVRVPGEKKAPACNFVFALIATGCGKQLLHQLVAECCIAPMYHILAPQVEVVPPTSFPFIGRQPFRETSMQDNLGK